MAGDFNTVHYPHERVGVDRLTVAMMEFSDFIDEMNLIDFHLKGFSYTWSNNKDILAMCWTDRFLVSTRWEGTFWIYFMEATSENRVRSMPNITRPSRDA